jgi:hypothetical protein
MEGDDNPVGAEKGLQKELRLHVSMVLGGSGQSVLLEIQIMMIIETATA